MKKIVRYSAFIVVFSFFITSLYGKNQSLEKLLIETGLVDIQTLDPTIAVELKYSTKDNFLGRDIYGNLDKCYLRKEIALKFVDAQKRLKARHPQLNMIAYDCVRPRRFQYKMWEIVKGTEKQIYVGNPKYGSMHNFGVAVDCSIIDEKGKPLDMGTPFDFFGKLAQPRYEDQLQKEGKLTEKQVQNRTFLRDAMVKAGFRVLSSEWWHFNGLDKAEAKKKYKIIE